MGGQHHGRDEDGLGSCLTCGVTQGVRELNLILGDDPCVDEGRGPFSEGIGAQLATETSRGVLLVVVELGGHAAPPSTWVRASAMALTVSGGQRSVHTPSALDCPAGGVQPFPSMPRR